MSMRRDAPELWAELVAAAREIVGDWNEDQIAAVIGKVQAPDPEVLMDHISAVLAWCAAAQKSGDEEDIAAVEIWQRPDMPLRITIEDGQIMHAIDVEDDA